MPDFNFFRKKMKKVLDQTLIAQKGAEDTERKARSHRSESMKVMKIHRFEMSTKYVLAK